MDDDVYLYTGITSVSSDESNIGFDIFILSFTLINGKRFFATLIDTTYCSFSVSVK